MKAPTRPPRGEENAIRMASSPSGELVGASFGLCRVATEPLARRSQFDAIK